MHCTPLLNLCRTYLLLTLLTASTIHIAGAKECPFGYDKSSSSSETICKNAYSIPSNRRIPSFNEILLQKLQIRTVSKPNGLLSKVLQHPISLLEGQVANVPEYLSWKRAGFGENFVVAGQVVLGEWEEVKKALTTPQARTFKLGTTPLSKAVLPKVDGKSSFLLALSQKGAGGDGSHEKYRSTVLKYLMNAETNARQDDSTAQGLMDKLVEDYVNMPHDQEGEFFNSKKGGLLPFLVRYLNYCLWGIDPTDEKAYDVLYDLYYGMGGALPLWYYNTWGRVLSFKTKLYFPRQIRKAIKVYENAPAIENYDASDGISKKDFIELAIPLMGIAAMNGPKSLIEVGMGRNPIPLYAEGVDTTLIKPTDFWDEIDLNNEKEVQAFLLESGRLNQPVGHTHRVAEEEFTVKILGRDRTFPKGTVISIPINMSCVNKNVWGENVFEFDYKRPNLFEDSTIFHSVGTKHAGRICPGTQFGLKMITEMFVKCGKARRILKSHNESKD